MSSVYADSEAARLAQPFLGVVRGAEGDERRVHRHRKKFVIVYVSRAERAERDARGRGYRALDRALAIRASAYDPPPPPTMIDRVRCIPTPTGSGDTNGYQGLGLTSSGR